MFRVVWAGCGFGMILNGNDRQRFMLHAFNALIVEIDVSDFDFGWQAISLNREAMIV